MDQDSGGGVRGSACEFFQDLTEKLCALVERHVDLHMPDDEGVTLYSELERQRVETGKIDPRLFPPTLPIGGVHIWDWFWELDRGRPESVSGMAKITHSQIAAWCSITGTVLRGHELRALLRMDESRIKATFTTPVRPSGVNGGSSLMADLKRMAMANRKRNSQMTPARFDSMFG